MTKTAILLAAGLGSRLGSETKQLPKCLLKVNGREILDYILESLYQAEISNLIIVTGHAQEKLNEFVNSRKISYPNLAIKSIHNPIYDSTNNIYSLKIALDICDKTNDVIILESDVWINVDIAKDFLKKSGNQVLASPYQYWMDGTCIKVYSHTSQVSEFIRKSE